MCVSEFSCLDVLVREGRHCNTIKDVKWNSVFSSVQLTGGILKGNTVWTHVGQTSDGFAPVLALYPVLCVNW